MRSSMVPCARQKAGYDGFVLADAVDTRRRLNVVSGAVRGLYEDHV